MVSRQIEEVLNKVVRAVVALKERVEKMSEDVAKLQEAYKYLLEQVPSSKKVVDITAQLSKFEERVKLLEDKANRLERVISEIRSKVDTYVGRVTLPREFEELEKFAESSAIEVETLSDLTTKANLSERLVAQVIRTLIEKGKTKPSDVISYFESTFGIKMKPSLAKELLEKYGG